MCNWDASTYRSLFARNVSVSGTPIAITPAILTRMTPLRPPLVGEHWLDEKRWRERGPSISSVSINLVRPFIRRFPPRVPSPLSRAWWVLPVAATNHVQIGQAFGIMHTRPGGQSLRVDGLVRGRYASRINRVGSSPAAPGRGRGQLVVFMCASSASRGIDVLMPRSVICTDGFCRPERRQCSAPADHDSVRLGSWLPESACVGIFPPR
jgi:hypothetical protein